MKFTKLAIFSALIVGSMAINGSIKKQLSERSHNNLAEVAAEVETE
jgi:hypothetical protein